MLLNTHKCQTSLPGQDGQRVVYASVMSSKSKIIALHLLVLLMCVDPARVLADSSTLRVAASGNMVPDENGRFNNFLEPVISNSNLVVFSASLYDTSGGNEDNSGIYRIKIPGGIGPTVVTLDQVAREGENLSVGNKSYRLGDLYPFSSYRPLNAPIADFTTGNFSRLALELPVLSGNDTGNTILAVGNDSGFQLVAEAGATVASGNGEYQEFNVLSIAGISSSNQVMFFSALNNTENNSDDNTAVFRYSPAGPVTEIIRKGEAVGGNALTYLATIRTNGYGDAVFLGSDGAGDSGLYRVLWSGTSPFLLVAEGDQAPTDDVGPRRFSQISDIRINNHGDAGFSATLRDESGFAVANDSGLYTTNGTSETEIVREGQPTPDGTASFMNFASELTGDVPHASFNDRGQFAFTVGLQLNGGGQPSEGVFLASESELIEVAREGDVYEDGTLRYFSDPVLNNQGLMAFTAELALETIDTPEGPYTVTNQVLILTDGVDYVTVAREGQMFDGKELREIGFHNATTGVANGLNDSATLAYEAIFTDASHAVHVWHSQLGWRSSAISGQWDDAGNWYLGTLPTFASEVTIDTASPVDIQGPSQDTHIHSLSLGGGGGMVRLMLAAGALTTQAGMTIGGNGTLSGSGVLGGNVHNQGLIDIDNDGVLEIDGDLLNGSRVSLGANAQLVVSGLLSGTGNIDGVDGLVVVNGLLAPGNSPGLLSVEGSVTLGPGSVTTLELAGHESGNDYDALEVGGTLTLAGKLDLLLIDDFTPQVGDAFILVQAGAIQGDFDAVKLPDIEGLSFQLEKTATTLVLNVQTESSGASSSSSGGTLSWLGLSSMILTLLGLRYRRKFRSL